MTCDRMQTEAEEKDKAAKEAEAAKMDLDDIQAEGDQAAKDTNVNQVVDLVESDDENNAEGKTAQKAPIRAGIGISSAQAPRPLVPPAGGAAASAAKH